MKRLARQYIWWPGMDQNIENMVKSCNVCQETCHKPPSATLHPWDWPRQPWQRVHADYVGPFLSRMFLILVDANTKWIDIHVINSSSAQITIEKMRTTFATLGLLHLSIGWALVVIFVIKRIYFGCGSNSLALQTLLCAS